MPVSDGWAVARSRLHRQVWASLLLSPAHNTVIFGLKPVAKRGLAHSARSPGFVNPRSRGAGGKAGQCQTQARLKLRRGDGACFHLLKVILDK